ncbi:MAG TPA: S1 RNA-binding domain-containing protein, partial [Polyangiaceae bacterium]|nr:S1 RNA-binding domain-containing protein [Polyangiaceae bacterium]
ILSINHDEKKVSLGVKQLWDDPWGTLMDEFKTGTVIENVEVLSVADYGAFVRLREGIEAIIPSGEMDAGVVLTAGEKVKAEVNNIDTMDRRITLSMRNPGASPAAEQLQVLAREKHGKGATLGDLLKEKLGDKLSTMTSTPPEADAAADAPAEAADAAPAEADAEQPTE